MSESVYNFLNSFMLTLHYYRQERKLKRQRKGKWKKKRKKKRSSILKSFL